MAEVVTVVPQPVAAAIKGTIDAHARQAKADGDARPIGQIRAELMTDMSLRPWDDSRPPVTAELRVLAPLTSLLPDPADPTAPPAPGQGGVPDLAPPDPADRVLVVEEALAAEAAESRE